MNGFVLRAADLGRMDFSEESVCGMDEAGRGPLAGPVCEASVVLPAGFPVEFLDDSKTGSGCFRIRPH